MAFLSKKLDSLRSQVRRNNLASLVMWAVIFTLAYSQAPLFTSNQNQYFLHGLAKAGFGYLENDWLANTLDPTPVFSWIVFLSYQVFSWLPIYYLYFGILAGVYLFSLAGIGDQLFGINRSRPTRWIFMTLFIGLNAAAVRSILVRILGTNWAYLFDGGVAGQRLLGEVLQPSTFGVLLLLSIYLFLRGNIFWSLLPLLLAPTVHPTYLLSAGVLTAVYMGITLWEQRNFRQPLMIGLLALIGVLPILLHTYLVFQPTTEQFTTLAREYLVEFRIPHHAQLSVWWDLTVVIKLLLIAVAIYLARGKRIFSILLFPFLVALFLTVIQVVSQSNTLALLFPWRISTVLVPLSLSIVLSSLVSWLNNSFEGFFHKNEKGFLITTLVISLLLALVGAGIFYSNRMDKANSLDRSIMEFVGENKTSQQVYLIPLHMQDFRLETGVPAYVEFKSIPYLDVNVLEWHRRVRLANRVYQAPYQRLGCEALSELSAEGVTHVVLPYDHTVQNCPNLERLFLTFEAYEVQKLTP